MIEIQEVMAIVLEDNLLEENEEMYVHQMPSPKKVVENAGEIMRPEAFQNYAESM